MAHKNIKLNIKVDLKKVDEASWAFAGTTTEGGYPVFSRPILENSALPDGYVISTEREMIVSPASLRRMIRIYEAKRVADRMSADAVNRNLGDVVNWLFAAGHNLGDSVEECGCG